MKVKSSTQDQYVECDLEFPKFKKQLLDLDEAEFERILEAVDKINRMTWRQVYATSSKGAFKRGLNWEALKQQTKNGDVIASIRLSHKCRARVTLDGAFMRFISLHRDHDNAYKARGFEDI